MSAATIKSRPIYPGLSLDGKARRHLIAAEGEGALAVLDVFADQPDEVARATLLYTPGGSAGEEHGAKLSALGFDGFHLMPTQPTLLIRLEVILQTATMGTRIYVAGVEGFIGKVIASAQTYGVDPQSVRAEHRGSLARRVQCVHCKGMTENVTATPFVCSHCGLNLFVRDHFSRRLGAFQGVCVDAEAPGELPAREELYL
ncbi:dimethylamine monooxygenase subunit DmmA family protein [Methylopila henanensis]|uniref:Dimethylamine monooxygenase subunit DmmA family protein n=1 Tax=Methylopila henanensis TaxID=873516 RepID=A0ABW4KD48_9HYPH